MVLENVRCLLPEKKATGEKDGSGNWQMSKFLDSLKVHQHKIASET
jgi:hypothetical protein